MEASIDKNACMLGDTIQANFKVDNSKNNYDLQMVKWKILQYFYIQSKNNHRVNIRKRIRVAKVHI